MATAVAARRCCAMSSPAFAVSKNVAHVKTLPEAKWATAINFLDYGGQDVMMVTGRFGLKSYSLADPANPVLLDEITSQDLELPGDPPTDFTVTEPGGDPESTFWQNEDMDVDQARKLVLISRDPRSYRGSTSREPGEADPNGATNIAGVYVVDAQNPARPEAAHVRAAADGPHDHLHQRLPVAVDRRPGGDDHAAAGAAELGGRSPAHRHRPARPGQPGRAPDGADRPVPPRRRHGLLARRPGRRHGHRVGLRPRRHARLLDRGQHRDPLTGQTRVATPLDPIPYAGGGFAKSETADDDGGFEHNAERPVGRSAPRRPTATATTCWRPRRTSPTRASAAASRATSTSPRSRAATTARRGARRPSTSSGSRRSGRGRRTSRRARARSAGRTRRAPISARRTTSTCAALRSRTPGTARARGSWTSPIPRHPKQIAYWRPDDTLVWASYFHGRYVYTADHVRGIDVLQLTSGARAARGAKTRGAGEADVGQAAELPGADGLEPTVAIPPRAGCAC